MVLIKWENVYILRAFSARAIKDKIRMHYTIMPSLEQILQCVSHTRDSIGNKPEQIYFTDHCHV